MQTEVSVICRIEAEKAEFNNSFIIHSARKIGDANTNKKQIVFKLFSALKK